MRKAGTQEKVLAQVVTSHITDMCTGRHKEESRNRPTASPSYHGRRGATRRKTPTASPGTAGQPHQVTQCHHIGPTPHHTGNRLDSHQCQRGSGNQSHRGHGAHPAHHCNRHWSPTDAALCMSVPPTLFPIRTLRLSTKTFHSADATQSSSSAYTTSRTAETEISSVWQYRRNAEDVHSPAAKMTPKGEPAAASEVALPALNAFKVHLFASLWPNSVSMRRTALRNEELVTSKRVAPAPLLRSSGATACTAQQCGDAPAQAQVRTSRLPCGLCFLLASLMWRESKPPSHD